MQTLALLLTIPSLFTLPLLLVTLHTLLQPSIIELFLLLSVTLTFSPVIDIMVFIETLLF